MSYERPTPNPSQEGKKNGIAPQEGKKIGLISHDVAGVKAAYKTSPPGRGPRGGGNRREGRMIPQNQQGYYTFYKKKCRSTI